MTPWFRVWNGISTDDKLMLVAKTTKSRLADVLAIWVYLLDQASQSDERGTIQIIDADDIGTLLDIAPDTVKSILTSMRTRKIIAGNSVSNWKKRQPMREDDSRERVRKLRGEKANAEHLQHDGENVTQCNAHVTQRNAPEQSREDKSIVSKQASSAGATPDTPDQHRDESCLPPFLLPPESEQSTVSVPRPIEQSPPDKQPPDYGAGEAGLGIVVAWREIVAQIWGHKPGWPSVRSAAHLLAGWVEAGWEPTGFAETTAYVLAKRHDRGDPAPTSMAYIDKALKQHEKGLPDDWREWLSSLDFGFLKQRSMEQATA